MRATALLVSIAFGLAGALSLPVEARAADKIQALIVSGANNHDWEWTSPSLKSILEETGRFEAVITNDPKATLADATGISRFQLFVLDYNGPRWGEPAETNFLAAVRKGAGVAVIHAADNAFEGWKEYELLVGDLWRAGTSHGQFHPFDVIVKVADHPITRGLGQIKQHPDELYHGLVHTAGAQHQVLATAFDDPKTGGTGREEPVIMAGTYGSGRVFHTPLGHVWKGGGHEAQEDPQFRKLVARGAEWAATGDVIEEKWVDLFNGKDLTGWTFFLNDGGKMEDTWSVKDGEIVCKGTPAGYIRTESDHANYVLELDWRYSPEMKEDGNSGVLLRMIGPDKVWPKSLEAQLQSKQAGDFWIIEEFPAKTAKERTNGRNCKATGMAEKPVGEWNHYKITADHGKVTLEINGQVLNEATDVQEVPGKICLQSEGVEIHFKNVRLRDL